MRDNLGNEIIIHVVGTKSDVVAQEPSLRKVPFERCIAYVAENLYSQKVSTPTFPGGSARSSGFWGQEIGTSLQSVISLSRSPFRVLGHTQRVPTTLFCNFFSMSKKNTDSENVKGGTVVMKLVHQMAKALKRCFVLSRESLLNRRTRRSRNNYKTAIADRARKEVKVATLKAFPMSKEASS